jgi:hypothetical protein
MAAYAADFVSARLRLLSVFQGGLEVVHGFPIPLGGINDRACIRALADFTDWLASVSVNTSRDLLASRNLFRKTVLVAGSPEASAGAGSPEASASSGSPAASEPLRYFLPIDLSGKRSGTFLSQPQTLPISINGIDADLESDLLNELILELNAKFITDLATLAGTDYNFILEEESCNMSGKRLIVMGASHAGRLADSLDGLDIKVVDLSIWLAAH